MPSMTKRVNVYAQVAVRNVTPPIYGTCKDIVMTTGDILKCLCKRARVEEILPDGKLVRLNMRNYYTDNGAGLDASKSVTKEVKKVENPARFKVPVAPKAQVVETKTVEEPKPEFVNENNDSSDFDVQEEVIVPVVELESNNEAPAEAENTIFVTGMTVGEVDPSEEDDALDSVETATDTVAASINYNNHHNKKKHKK